MDRDAYSGSLANEFYLDRTALGGFHQSFLQVQNILDQNRLLINQINQNQHSKLPENLSRNVGLIRELNNNIKRVASLYADLSISFVGSDGVSSEGESKSSGTLKSNGKASSYKRMRPE